MPAISSEVRGVRPPRRRASIVKALLTSTALVNAGVAGLAVASTLSLVAIVASTSAARADGGKGGDSEPGTGGAGGIGISGAPGSAGSTDTGTLGIPGGGGGGGAGGGGNGGAAGGVNPLPGGAGGTSAASPNGTAGGAGSGSGGGGGGGFNGAVAGNGGSGGAAANIIGGVSLSGFAGGGGGGGGFGLGTGGAGGAGGAGGQTLSTITSTTAGATVSLTSSAAQGGGGGDGGIGNLQAGPSFTFSTNSLGGAGGVGGVGGASETDSTDNAANATAVATAKGGIGGNGGAGGAGARATGSGTLFFDALVAGAAGGAGGAGGVATATASAAPGAGGIAIANATGGTGGNGGSGGNGIEVTSSNVTVDILNVIQAGAGGHGGAGGNSTGSAPLAVGSGVIASGGNGGNGGTGGTGAVFAGPGVSVNSIFNINGGAGGTGGAAGNNLSDPNFLPGGPTTGGNGGAGGTGVLFTAANATFTNFNGAQVTGGQGGSGGNNATLTGGTNGAGGAGVVFAAPATLINSAQITGGQGGNSISNTAAGTGGAGVLASNSTITNSAPGAITGGNGGSPGASGTDGGGGVAIAGAGLTINNSGTIAGGRDGINLITQIAIQLTGGVNAISPGGTINGGIQLQAGSLMPALSGSTVGPTLNVTGPVSFAAGSTYSIRVNGAANDSITTGGSQFSQNPVATVSGANVAATISGGNAAFGKHTIITAGNGVVGTFASLSAVSSSAFLLESLSYDPTHVFLNITGNGANGGFDFTPVAQTTNQANVASALNTAGNANGFSGALFNAIVGLSAAQARAAFTALDGEAATGAQRASFRLMDEFLNLMLDPFVEGHFGNPSGGGATGFAPEQQAELPPEITEAYASAFKTAPPANFDQRWSVWNAAFGGSGKTSGDPIVGSSDTRLSTFGFAAGVDYRFSPYTTIGLAAAGGGTNWGLANGLGGGRSDSAQIGVYAKTRVGPAYLAESVAFASHWFSTDRSALGDNLHAVFTGQSFGGRIEGGYRFAVTPTLGITPYAAAQAQAFRSGAYSETDVNNAGFALSYAAKEATDVRTELGARLDNPTLLNGTPLIIRARLAWAHDIVDTPSLVAAFQTLPLSNFTVLGAAIPKNSGLASLGADWYLNRDWKLTAKFDGEFASRSDIYAGTVSLRYAW